jgi:hypothetical protein
MPKNKKRKPRVMNPDLRHRSDFPTPPVEEMEHRWFANRPYRSQH